MTTYEVLKNINDMGSCEEIECVECPLVITDMSMYNCVSPWPPCSIIVEHSDAKYMIGPDGELFRMYLCTKVAHILSNESTLMEYLL